MATLTLISLGVDDSTSGEGELNEDGAEVDEVGQSLQQHRGRGI
jgi:hypothetical protein